MKIAIVGCGALGTFYGAMLARAGAEMHFLLRSDYEAVRQNGVTIHDLDKTFHIQPHAAKSPEEIGHCDFVLIGLKTTANHQFPKLLPPLVGPHTAVVTLQNGLGNEEQLAALFPPEQVMGGLCFVCLNRTAPGVIVHKARGKVVLGEFNRPAQDRTRELAAWFNRAGVHCETTDDLARTHWEKLIWNIPFNGLGVAGVVGYENFLAGQTPPAAALTPVLSTDILLGDVRWENIVRELMAEVIAAANALGLGVSPTLADKQIERTRGMGAYKASTLIDFEQRRPLEMESMYLEPLRQAQKAGVPVPRMTTLCRVLTSLEKQHIAK